MGFYKLYKVIHRRTDTSNLMDEFDRMIRPWYYELKSKRARMALARFMAAGALINCMDINSMYPELVWR